MSIAPYRTVPYYREFLEDFRGFVELWFGTVPVRTVPLEKNGNFSIEKFPLFCRDFVVDFRGFVEVCTVE